MQLNIILYNTNTANAFLQFITLFMYNKTMEKDRILKKEIIKNIPSHYDIHIIDTIDSTNSEMKRNSNAYKDGHVLIARTQTGGRGRNNRTFFCHQDCGIYMTLFLRPKFTGNAFLKVTACTAAAAALALEKLYPLDIGIKWVNDLIIQDKKIAGILCESSLCGNGSVDYMIVGIGLNIHHHTLPDAIQNTAGCVEDFTDLVISRNEIIAAFLNQFDNYYKSLSENTFLTAYRSHSCTIDKEIIVTEGRESYSAKAIDINEEGHLIILKNNKKIPLCSGEIHILPIPLHRTE